MVWERTDKYGIESWKIGKYHLIRWETIRLWALYLDGDDWREESRIIELPYETSTTEAKEKALEALIDKLSNKESREMLGD